MTSLSPQALAIRQRLKDNFPFYSEKAVRIRTKEGEVKPFVLNKVQIKLNALVEDQLRTTGKVRIVILKARQQGLSTYASAWNYWRLSHSKGKKGLVVAHIADSTKSLFDLYKRVHEEMPDALKPSTKYSSRKELAFDKLDSGIMVATAGGDGIARGETIQVAHLSEVAFWPNATAADNMNALMQAIPNTPGSSIFVESTANGMAGVFYDLWQGAVNGTNGFVPFFSPWFDSDEYRLPTEPFELTIEEEELVKLYGLDFEQLAFRRQRIAQNGLDAWNQEYPSNPDEAFIASGRPVFNPDQLHARLKVAPEPLKRMAVELEGDKRGVLRDHSRGELLVYREYDPKQTYTIGADVGMGLRNGDYSVAQVFDGQKRQVAVWRSQVHPDYFASVLYALGLHYNTALIAPENNAHGLLTAVRLGRDLAYPNIFTDVSEGNLADKDSITIGFRTTAKTKPLIIDRLRASLREGEIELNDKTTIREMLTYVVTEEGKLEAEQGCHDDCVMAMAICNHVHVRQFTPYEVTDEYYHQHL
jgi:hypothetical protein